MHHYPHSFQSFAHISIIIATTSIYMYANLRHMYTSNYYYIAQPSYRYAPYVVEKKVHWGLSRVTHFSA